MSEPATRMAKEQERAVTAAKPAAVAARGRSWPAFRELAFDRMLEELFDDFDRGFRWPARLRRHLEPAFAEAPRLAKIDVFESGDDVVVKAEIPGVTREQVDVAVAADTVTIKAEKSREEKVEQGDYHRSERSFGSVSRVIDLPVEVKADKAVAKLADGVLEIRVPKSDAAKASTVKVKVQ